MFASIRVQNFRGLKDIRMEQFDRINLIAGRNGVGKTALLEALFILSGARNISLVPQVTALRGFGKIQGDAETIREILLKPAFAEFDTTRVIEITGRTGGGREFKSKIDEVQAETTHLPIDGEGDSGTGGLTNGVSPYVLRLQSTDSEGTAVEVRLSFVEKGLEIKPAMTSPPFPCVFVIARATGGIKQDAERFGRLEEKKSTFNLVRSLQVIEPRLRSLKTIFKGELPIIHGDIGLGKLVPIPLMGDGIVRLTALLLAICDSQDGVVLVDEVENGLHHTVFQKVWESVREAAIHCNCQVFATTHNLEFVRAAHRAFQDKEPYGFRLHRLECVGNKIRAINYDKDALNAAIDAELEVR